MKVWKYSLLFFSFAVCMINASCLGTAIHAITGSKEVATTVAKGEMYLLYGIGYPVTYARLGVRALMTTNADALITLYCVDQYGSPITGLVYRGYSKRRESSYIDNIKFQGMTSHSNRIDIETKIESYCSLEIYAPGHHTEHVSIIYPDGLKLDSDKNTVYRPFVFCDTIVLYRRTNPVNLKYVNFMPDLCKPPSLPCGFDLLVGDWVSQGHKGKRIDCIFSSDSQFFFKILFPNPCDGIQPIPKRNAGLEYVAPDTGYFKEYPCVNQSFFFKIRSQDGHGGIYGRFLYFNSYSDDEIVTMYCINPEKSRNLEPIE